MLESEHRDKGKRCSLLFEWKHFVFTFEPPWSVCLWFCLDEALVLVLSMFALPSIQPRLLQIQRHILGAHSA